MKLVKQKTKLSVIWELDIFGRSYVFGWIDTKIASQVGVDNANILLEGENEKK